MKSTMRLVVVQVFVLALAAGATASARDFTFHKNGVHPWPIVSIAFNEGPVGTTVAQLCVGAGANTAFQDVLAADLERIGTQLRLREMRLYVQFCASNGGLVTWNAGGRGRADSPATFSLVVRALVALPYVLYAEAGGGGEPDVGSGPLPPGSGQMSAGTETVDGAGVHMSWGSLKQIYR